MFVVFAYKSCLLVFAYPTALELCIFISGGQLLDKQNNICNNRSGGPR